MWTPDGQHLLYVKAIANPLKQTVTFELWRVSPRDTAPQKVGVLASDVTPSGGWVGLRIHPDGKTIGFHTERQTTEVWVMENFLPATKR